MLRHLILPTCLLVVLVCRVTGRSVLLKRLTGRRNSDGVIDQFYRELADFVELKGREPRQRNINPNAFLEQFGYLQPLPPGVGHDPASRTHAIRQFQKMYHLKQTGQLDDATLSAMVAPRCGMPDTSPVVFTDPTNIDVEKRYFVPGNYKWSKTDLNYHFRNFARTPTLDHETQKRAFERAFKMWSDVSPLVFRETNDRGDLNLEFVTGVHTDGAQNAFDGPGGVLAHAFYPTNGELHLDDTEPWVDRKEEGIDITTVAAHELGHALGIGHSAEPGALMAPYYQGYDPEFVLTQDDIDAIQFLYGKKDSGGRPPVTTKPAATTTTTRTTTPTTTTTKKAPVETGSDGPPDTCTVPFRAITQIHDTSILMFNGRWLWRLTADGLDEGYPVETRSIYMSAPNAVDAAIYAQESRYTYLFYKNMVWKYYGFRRESKSNVTTQESSGSFTDVIVNTDGKIYLMKGTDCWLFDERALTVGKNPVACKTIFGKSFPTSIDSTLQLVEEPNYVYLFKAADYFKYDLVKKIIVAGYPKLKAGPWMGPACGGKPRSPK